VPLTFPRERSGWGEDNPIVEAEVINVAEAKLRRLYIPLDQARHAIAHNVGTHFEMQEDYDGMAWTPWSESYDARQNNLGEILQRTYELEYAASNPDNYRIISGSISGGAYGSGEVALIGSNLPDYWIFHEQGIPDRKTGALPKRSFAGLDAAGIAEMDTIFEEFADGALVGTLVTGQPMGRGGQFRTFFR
jgi:hypothetical protein